MINVVEIYNREYTDGERKFIVMKQSISIIVPCFNESEAIPIFMQEMEKIANRIVSYLDTDQAAWNEIERMQMILGLQVLIHNIVMTGTILFLALLTGMLWEAAILLTAYGALKMTVGGVHFKTSCACLTATTAFVMTGVLVSRRLDIGFMSIAAITYAA